MAFEVAGCTGGQGEPFADRYSCVSASNDLLMEDAPPFEDWLNATTHKLSDGSWVFEEDIIVFDEADLQSLYIQQFRRPRDDQPALPVLGFRSTVACDNTHYNTWLYNQKFDLTYCIGDFTTPGLRETVVDSIASATQIWEQSGDFNFVRVNMETDECNCIYDARNDPAVDKGNCPSFSNRARIRIREMTDAEHTTGRPASASFPNASKPQFIRIHKSFLNWNGVEDRFRLMLHELGHVLGLMHEHYRFQGAEGSGSDCDSFGARWRTVTDPDSASIMGYGICSGIDGIFFSPNRLSPRDRLGVSYLYNLPRNNVLSFSSPTINDLLWYKPSSLQYSLWRAQLAPNDAVQFPETARTEFCALEVGGECLQIAENKYTKPIALELSEAGASDIITYGPGADTPDSLLLHTDTDGFEQHTGYTNTQPFDLPIVGNFLLFEPLEDVWWIRPGEESDPVGKYLGGVYNVDEDEDYGGGSSKDSFRGAIVGHWVDKGSNAPNSQVLWYRQRDNTIGLSYQATNGLSMLSELLTPSCSLGEIGDTTPLRGDFDGDGELEIFWVAYESGQHVLWRDTFSLWSGDNNEKCADTDIVRTIAPNGFEQVVSKPFVADFDGDGADDIFWLAPPIGNATDKIWLRVGLDDGPLIVDPIIAGAKRPAGDRTPFAGDYNGDACDDILWYSPDSEFRVLTDSGATLESVSGTSPLWQSSCSHDDSVINFQFSTVTPPMEATPVGFDPRSSVRTH